MTKKTRAVAAAAGLAAAYAGKGTAQLTKKDIYGDFAETISEFPDRLSMERVSPYFSDACEFIGVRIDGEEQALTVEYCISERWARIGKQNADKSLRRMGDGTMDTTKREGVDVEVYWRLKPSRQVRRAMQRQMEKMSK